uniref:FBD domain-containing protein n=1 Tax=Oryza punctata TaxID=4537 RepID=A0A0E0M1S7_ORYPU
MAETIIAVAMEAEADAMHREREGASIIDRNHPYSEDEIQHTSQGGDSSLSLNDFAKESSPSNHGYSKVLQKLGIINDLPIEIVCIIVSKLPIKDAARSYDPGTWKESDLFWQRQSRKFSSKLRTVEVEGFAGTHREVDLIRFILYTAEGVEKLVARVDEEMEEVDFSSLFFLEDEFRSIQFIVDV